MTRATRLRWLAGLALALLAGCRASSDAADAPRGFATPEAAVQALLEVDGDPAEAERVLGPGAGELIGSGDDVADAADRARVRALAAERLAFEEVADGHEIALLGEAGWELPLPLVRVDGRWSFDLAAGSEELLNRRVGRNELSTIATLRALVTAQREYFSASRDGQPPAFAQRLVSGEGRQDGLYWPTAEGEPPSPIGPLLADAADEGYRLGEGEPVPYHGYHYRLLTAQGEHAPGGARSYLDDDGRLTGGFAVLAWPAEHDRSGVMTFLVSQLGIVHEKDLGERTAELVDSIERFDPDPSWSRTTD